MAPVRIEFAEQFAYHLKLTVTDDRNSPLALSVAMSGGSADACQAVFQSNGTIASVFRNPGKALGALPL